MSATGRNRGSKANSDANSEEVPDRGGRVSRKTAKSVAAKLAALWMTSDERASFEFSETLFDSGEIDDVAYDAYEFLPEPAHDGLVANLRDQATDVQIDGASVGEDVNFLGSMFFVPAWGSIEDIDRAAACGAFMRGLELATVDFGLAAPGSKVAMCSIPIDPVSLSYTSPGTMRDVAAEIAVAIRTEDFGRVRTIVTTAFESWGDAVEDMQPPPETKEFGERIFVGMRLVDIDDAPLPMDVVAGFFAEENFPEADSNHDACEKWCDHIAALLKGVSGTEGAAFDIPATWSTVLLGSAVNHVDAMFAQSEFDAEVQPLDGPDYRFFISKVPKNGTMHVSRSGGGVTFGPIVVPLSFVTGRLADFADRLRVSGSVHAHVDPETMPGRNLN